MITEPLYYQDAYLREFSARVTARGTLAGRPALALDRSAFYPTGGGQPNDTGTLAGLRVVDVTSAGGQTWHVLPDGAGPLPQVGDTLQGRLDWARRFEHMQQHTGQHILSQAFVVTANAETVAFHLGASACTIDLNRADLTPADLAAAEAAANAVLDEARPVAAAFVTQAELAQMPLRKPPKVTEAIRVVQVAGFDWSACGGTHVANAAQVGLVKIVGTERRGGELRVSFLCGGRARADHARLLGLVQGLAVRFNAAQDDLLDASDRRAAEMAALRRELADLEEQWAQSAADALWASAEERGAWRIVATAGDFSIERAKRLAQLLRTRPGAVVLLGARGERPQLICARADDVPLDAGALLRIAVAAGGGRGGGRPDWAQGGTPTVAGLERALAAGAAAVGG